MMTRARRVREGACTYRMPRHTPRRRTGETSAVLLIARMENAGAVLARLPRETVRLNIKDPIVRWRMRAATRANRRACNPV